MDYLTKTELAKRWSWGLIDRFCPECDKEVKNPHHKNAKPIQLYNMHRIRLIESTHVFRIEWDKMKKRKKIINMLQNIKS